jgi:hypothetical protein
MSKMTGIDRCPRCGHKTVDRDNRRCKRIECQTPLLFQGDSASKLDPEQPWFMFLKDGPRGTGWYRKPFVATLKNW